MITITQGPPAEHQVWIMAGIVTYLFVAPLVIGGACLCGWLAGRKLSAQQKIVNSDQTAVESDLPTQWKLDTPTPIYDEAHLETAA
jgi:hypothetical protein